MSQNEIHDIDELLNSFLDGELDQRQQTEVQRLIKHDKQVAERLLALQKCKMLVSSLPYNEAPPELLGDIKASLGEKKLLVSAVRRDYAEGEQPVRRQQRREHEGARHLILRRLTAAAAMIGLASVLAAVIYSIVVPEPVPDKPVAVLQPPVAEKPIENAAAKVEFSGKLELKTGSPSEVAAFINKMIEFSIYSDQPTAVDLDKTKESLILACSSQNLKSLMTDLGTIWDKIDSATLFVDTNRSEGQIIIDAVSPEQIIKIAEQDNLEAQLRTATYFASINNIAEYSPGKEVLIAIDDSTPPLMTIPKPVLTSSEKPIIKVTNGTQAEQQVLLTIVVIGSE